MAKGENANDRTGTPGSESPDERESGAVTQDYHDLKRSWELLGEEDSLWAILSSPGKEGGGWDIEEFFETGRTEIEQLISGYMQELAVQPSRDRALDFGCGVGRLSRALSRHFERVDGIDISEAMIRQAEALNSDRPGLHFCHMKQGGLPFEDGVFDLVYSRLVLQHIPTSLALGYVEQFVRVLKPGGLAVFQAPSRPRVEVEVLPSPVPLSGGVAYIEMHAHSRKLVEARIFGAGGKIVDIREDDCAGEAFESLRYAVTV